MAKKCKIIYWDKHLRVYGVVATLSAKFQTRILSSYTGMTDDLFVQQLRDVDKGLKCKDAEIVLISGFLQEFICFEFFMPEISQKQIQDSLRFELPRRLPLKIDEMCYFFRKISSIPKAEGGVARCKVRVLAVRKNIWHNLMNNLVESGIKADAFCHPFLAVDFSDQMSSINMDNFTPGVSLNLNDDGLAIMMCTTSELINNVHTNVEDVLLPYALGKNFPSEKSFLSTLPEKLNIRRYTWLRNAIFLLSILASILCGSLCYRYWNDRNNVYSAYKRKSTQLDKQILAHGIMYEEVKNRGELAEKMLHSTKHVSLLPVLSELSDKLPSNIWVHSLRAGNQQLALTLSVSGDAGNLNKTLSEFPGWILNNIRQQRDSDGREIWYVTLKQIH